MKHADISIIIPTLNEAGNISTALNALLPERRSGVEVIVVDGVSHDRTLTLAQPLCDLVATSQRGRATQMNAGAALASGNILLFLHADTRLPDGAAMLVRDALGHRDRVWGRFDVQIDSGSPLLRLVSRMINIRSRWSGIATGDQAIFIRRDVFERIGGFPDIPLMEDIALSRALRTISKPATIRAPVMTSSRRWQQHGVVRTILLMWQLRLAYYCGADPRDLALRYGYVPRHD